MERIQHSTDLTVTPEIAAQWLGTRKYEFQRTLRRDTVDKYAKAMTEGRWLPGTQIKIAVVPNGKEDHEYLVDGQHRLQAVAESGVPQKFATTFVRCRDMHDVARHYYQTDRGAGRSIADTYRTEQIGPELGLASDQLNTTGAGVRFILTDFHRQGMRSRTTDESTLAALRDYAAAIETYWEIVGNKKSYAQWRAMKRAPVIAVALATLRYATLQYGEQKVEDFWRGVAYDDGLRTGDPRKVAYEHLIGTNIATMSRGTKATSANFQARYVANCWNKWSDNESDVKFVRVNDANAPIKINGTPWNGEQ